MLTYIRRLRRAAQYPQINEAASQIDTILNDLLQMPAGSFRSVKGEDWDEFESRLVNVKLTIEALGRKTFHVKEERLSQGSENTVTNKADLTISQLMKLISSLENLTFR